MKVGRAWLAALGFSVAAIEASPWRPQLVSPRRGDAEARVGTVCPTFTWTVAADVTGYSLVIFPAGETDRVEPRSSPLIAIELPAGASSWVPTLEECLPGDGRYAWAVGARNASGELGWAEPSVFRVDTRSAGLPRKLTEEPAATRDAPAVAVAGPATPRRAPAEAPRAVTDQAFAPICLGDMFTDVTGADPLCAWMEQLGRDGISDGCGGGNYCPKQPVTRDQLALMLGRAMRGTDRWSPRRVAPPAPPTITPMDPSVGFQLTMTTGADGLALAIYYRFSDNMMVIAHCSDLACSAATTTPIHTAAADPAIAIGSDGLALFTYDIVSGGGTSDVLHIAHCNDIPCSSFTTITPDPAGYVPYPSPITIGADGLALVAYGDWTAGTENIARCADLACSSAPVHPIRGSVDDPTAAAATGIDGLGFIVYGEYAAGYTLVAARCTDAACSTATFNPINTGGTVGDQHSVAIGADGLPLVVFTRNGDLGVAHCADPACSSSVFAMLDTVGNVGDYNAIAIGSDGLAVISYVDFTNQAVNVAHCSDYKCSAATTTRLDGKSPLGTWTAIAIGGDGLPVVAYRGSTGALEIAHCSNVLCEAFFLRP